MLYTCYIVRICGYVHTTCDTYVRTFICIHIIPLIEYYDIQYTVYVCMFAC